MVIKRFLILLLSAVFLFSAFGSTILNAEEMEIGKVYHGFKLVKQKLVKEQDAVCKLFEHEKTGARVLKIEAKDDNKFFCISFKTPPESDSGIPHILEHSVLNGSKHFPVKRPFAMLKKGSLHTFMNAFTGKDLTMYPVASRNQKDYFNLMHVYLDAVLFPNIYTDPNILKQEGWHYELDKKDGEIVYKGVVFNEMKGAFSDPNEDLNFYIFKYLFPESPYRFESGGYPQAIPELTSKQFLSFHKRYYHPSNSYLCLYGDGDLDKELSFINDNYFSKFDKIKVDSFIPLQKPFTQMKDIIEEYAIPTKGNDKDQTFLSLSFVMGEGTQRDLAMALDILSTALVNQPAAPIRRALIDAGIGKDVNAGSSVYKQNVFTITVTNANVSDKDKFKKIVFDTLKKTVKEGLDKKVLEGLINRTEFNLREGDSGGFPKAFMDYYISMTGWMFKNDPFLGLEYEKPLKILKTSLTSNYLEKIIDKYMLKNNHALLLTLKPKKGLVEDQAASVKKKLANYKTSLTDDQLEKLVNNTKELKEYQRKPDSPEAVKTIPLLSLEDINPKARDLKLLEKEEAGIKVLHFPTFTNSIIYQKLLFDTSAVPQELIPYAQLLSDIMGDLNTKNYSYGDLDTQLNIHTGDFDNNLTVYEKNSDSSQLLPLLSFDTKVMAPKVEKLFDLEGEIIKYSKYNDPQRLKEILTQRLAKLEGRVKTGGIFIAITRLNSYLSPAGKYKELTTGLEYYRFISKIIRDFDKNSEQVIANLEKVAQIVFNKDNLTVGVSCSNEDYVKFQKHFPKIIGFLGNKTLKPATYKFDFSQKNEGLQSASKIQYVLQGYDFKKMGYDYSGKMLVLKQILSRGFLYKALRVMGGAYGAIVNINRDGFMWFGSYRDPNLEKTFENYEKSVQHLQETTIDQRELTRYIIGTVAGEDRPWTPSMKLGIALNRYFNNTTFDQIQKKRDQILQTTAEDIKQMSKLISEMLKKKYYCVYGNEKKIEDAKERFGKLVKVMD